MTIYHAGDLRPEEAQAIDQIERAGTLSVQIYRRGVYSEADFVLYGVLERLVIRGRLVYLGLTRAPQNATYTYGLPVVSIVASSEDVRAAA